MKLVIDRSKWLQGEASVVSMLLRPQDGKMCCLGFYCLALGAPEKSINRVHTPLGDEGDEWLPTLIDKVVLEKAEWLFDGTTVVEATAGKKESPWKVSADCLSLMQVNDDMYESAYDPPIEAYDPPIEVWRSNKEEEIKKRFAEHGVEVEFTGEY